MSDQTAPHPSELAGPARPAAPGHAHWGKRVGASVIDQLTTVPFLVAIVATAFATHHSHTVTLGQTADGSPATVEISDGLSGTGLAIIGLLWLAMVGFSLWNVVLRQGRTGRSLGKSALGITLVREDDARFVGAARTFVRQLAHVLDAFLLLGYLWPLWDAKRQTFADKVCGTVVLDGPAR